MKGLKLLEAFIKEEIGRNYHTVNPDPITWSSFQDYEINYYPQENGQYLVDISYEGEKIVPTGRFQNETECKHFARMVIDKHRVSAMNSKNPR